MNLLIAGSRYFTDYSLANEFINSCLQDFKEEQVTILSGGCRGADAIGERYANEHGYGLCRYPADWKRYGKAAGPIRNRIMVENADVIICFLGENSRGSRSVIDIAHRLEKRIFIMNV